MVGVRYNDTRLRVPRISNPDPLRSSALSVYSIKNYMKGPAC